MIVGGIVLPQTVCAEDVKESELYARAAVLMDGDSGRVLYSKNGLEPLANASTTKILTCIIALENCDLEQTVEFSARAASAPKVHLGAAAGKKFRMKDLISAMMLESFNDCAVAIAEQIGGSVEAFSGLMNDYARQIGCTDSYFLTPNGLDAEDGNGYHHTTANDLALIMRYCIRQSPKADLFLGITAEAEHSFSDLDGTMTYHCYNHNAFLNMMDGALSGKTGFTGKAGYCYVGALEQNGKTLIVALLACGWPNHKTYKWQDTKKLMEYGLASYQKVEVEAFEPKIKIPAYLPVENGCSERIGEESYAGLALKKKEGVASVLKKEEEAITIEYRIAETLTAPVEKESIVGEVCLKLHDQVLQTYEVLTTEEIPVRTFYNCLYQVYALIL